MDVTKKIKATSHKKNDLYAELVSGFQKSLVFISHKGERSSYDVGLLERTPLEKIRLESTTRGRSLMDSPLGLQSSPLEKTKTSK
ncbi:hypothetical protein KIN20_006368, partial [Parelaphostrongylus tenuis]